jgi:hypothetical protein
MVDIVSGVFAFLCVDNVRSEPIIAALIRQHEAALIPDRNVVIMFIVAHNAGCLDIRHATAYPIPLPRSPSARPR